MSARSSVSIEILEGDIFDDLAAPWTDLLDRSDDNRLFLTPEWVKVWWRHFGSNTPLFVTVAQDKHWQALLPLYIRTHLDQRILTLQGSADVADYLDGIADQTDAPALLHQALAAALDRIPYDQIEFHHVPASSPLLPALQELTEPCHLDLLIEQEEVCPIAPLTADWEGYLQALTKKQRHEIRRKLRRFSAGAETSHRISETQDDLDRDLPEFFRLHHLSADAKASFMTPAMQAFFTDMARVMLDRGYLRLSILTRDQVDVAATMSFMYGEHYLLYNSGYDPAYAAHSPGIAAVAAAIQDALSLKATVFDFLSGNEPYKYQFGATDTSTCLARASHRIA